VVSSRERAAIVAPRPPMVKWTQREAQSRRLPVYLTYRLWGIDWTSQRKVRPVTRTRRAMAGHELPARRTGSECRDALEASCAPAGSRPGQNSHRLDFLRGQRSWRRVDDQWVHEARARRGEGCDFALYTQFSRSKPNRKSVSGPSLWQPKHRAMRPGAGEFACDPSGFRTS
jgi:hypothetical protein